MKKMKKVLIFSISAAVLVLSGCAGKNSVLYFEGPRDLSSEAQTVEYIPKKKNVSFDVSKVSYQVLDSGADTVVSSGVVFYDSAVEGYSAEWFTVRQKEGLIELSVGSNAVGYEREVSIEYITHGSLLSGFVIDVTQK